LHLEEFKRIRKICGSVTVAQQANRYRETNIRSPPRRLPKKLNVAPPVTRDKKNKRRSAPATVRGLFNDRYTGCNDGAFDMGF
jgi:hypothetical protein